MKNDLGIDMVLPNEKNKFDELPTLEQVLLVEEFLQNINSNLITVVELKKKLSTNLKNKTLITVLDYLEAMNKIVVTSRGITWIHNTNPKLRKAISEGLSL